MEDKSDINRMEKAKVAAGTVTIVGMGRLGIRTCMNLLEVHRGGPSKLIVIDGQKISDDDIKLKLLGGIVGEYKVDLIKKIIGSKYCKEVIAINQYINKDNLNLIEGDVVCIGIAGGDTLATTADIIKKSHEIGAKTVGSFGVFGVEKGISKVFDIEYADKENPIVKGLNDLGINKNHKLVGTQKLIRDWEPVTPYILDEIAEKMTEEILKLLHD